MYDDTGLPVADNSEAAQAAPDPSEEPIRDIHRPDSTPHSDRSDPRAHMRADGLRRDTPNG
ncbi:MULTISPECIES: hypothetical protein [unclassified Streptomyces]|jgi:hypothetical protein|uniref:hypothetical protein n=1 Tax=unclassified Streptomyces TaxID=2593676 RepID=UPI0033A8F44C